MEKESYNKGQQNNMSCHISTLRRSYYIITCNLCYDLQICIYIYGLLYIFLKVKKLQWVEYQTESNEGNFLLWFLIVISGGLKKAR